MDKRVSSVSAYDCDVLRGAFHKLVVEESVPEDRWRELASQLVRDLTGKSVDLDLLEWIVRK